MCEKLYTLVKTRVKYFFESSNLLRNCKKYSVIFMLPSYTSTLEITVIYGTLAYSITNFIIS